MLKITLVSSSLFSVLSLHDQSTSDNANNTVEIFTLILKDHSTVVHELVAWVVSLMLYTLMLLGSFSTFLTVVRRNSATFNFSIVIHSAAILLTAAGLIVLLAVEADDLLLSLTSYAGLISFIALIQTMRIR